MTDKTSLKSTEDLESGYVGCGRYELEWIMKIEHYEDCGVQSNCNIRDTKHLGHGPTQSYEQSNKENVCFNHHHL